MDVNFPPEDVQPGVRAWVNWKGMKTHLPAGKYYEIVVLTETDGICTVRWLGYVAGSEDTTSNTSEISVDELILEVGNKKLCEYKVWSSARLRAMGFQL